MQHTELERTLRALADTCHRSAQTYLDCSRRCRRVELKSFLALHANGCLDAAQSLVTLLDPDNAVGAPPMAAVLQGREGAGQDGDAGAAEETAITDDELDLLEECEQAADEALDAYDDAVALDLPASARSLVASQRDGALRTHDQIRALRDRAAADRDAADNDH
jgi:hypothetical protein